MSINNILRIASVVVVVVGVVLGSGTAEAATAEEWPEVEVDLLDTADANVPAPFVIEFSSEFELAFTLLSSTFEPELDGAAAPDLSCERGCVLEYNACMWTDYALTCDATLDVCSQSCN